MGGTFHRSESGRTFVVRDASGGFLANAALASRKDARDAVVAARTAFGTWSGMPAHNRGQVLYRVAEVLEARRTQFASEMQVATGVSTETALHEVDAAVDRWIWYAGWADKIAQVRGGMNPVAGPFLNFSVPEPSGVAAVLAPQDSALLGLVSVIAPAIVSGGTAVVVASSRYPLPAITLSEVLAASEVPGGVVNVLTGDVAEISPWLASHLDVNAIDVTGAPGVLADDLAAAAAHNLKRVIRPPFGDWTTDPGLDRLIGYLETKTVWHPLAW
ncbi:MAG TPA: aldehyde dehydrogenase family protein [Trebonia sp.]|nr:aldehyde dehydrogenase family protein [Trebonia sp.]